MSSHPAVLRKWLVPGGGEVYLAREMLPSSGIDVRYVMHFKKGSIDSECEPRVMPDVVPSCDYFILKKSSGLKILVTDSAKYSVYELGSGMIRCLDGRGAGYDGLIGLLSREVSQECLRSLNCQTIECMLEKMAKSGCHSVIEIF